MGVSGTDGGSRASGPGFRALVESPRYTFWSVTGIAAGVGVSEFLLGYRLARDGGFERGYLRSPTMALALVGTVGGLVLLLWGAKYHLRVWEGVRRCFAVSDEEYDEFVEPVLRRAYDVKRVLAEFLAILLVVGLVDWVLFVPIPWAITAGFTPEKEPPPCAAGWLQPCLDYLSAINYLYGAVGLFVVVGGVHGVAHFLPLASRLTELPLRNVDTAAEHLEPIAQFSVFVATSVFGGVLLLSLVYARLLELAGGRAGIIVDYALVVILVVAGLLLLGMLVFWLPQMAIHATLTEAKQERLAALDREYAALSRRAQMESEPIDRIATELDVLDARRRNVREVRTWAYNLPTLIPLVGSGIASALLWFVQFVNQLT